MMISRLVLSIRKVNNQRTGVMEWVSRPIVFAPNYELPVHTQSTQPHMDSLGFSSSEASFSRDFW